MIAIPQDATHAKISAVTGRIIFYKYDEATGIVQRWQIADKAWVHSHIDAAEFNRLVAYFSLQYKD